MIISLIIIIPILILAGIFIAGFISEFVTRLSVRKTSLIKLFFLRFDKKEEKVIQTVDIFETEMRQAVKCYNLQNNPPTVGEVIKKEYYDKLAKEQQEFKPQFNPGNSKIYDFGNMERNLKYMDQMDLLIKKNEKISFSKYFRASIKEKYLVEMNFNDKISFSHNNQIKIEVIGNEIYVKGR